MGVALDRLFETLHTQQERLYVTGRLRGLSEVAAYRAAGGKGSPGPQSFIRKEHVVAVLEAAFNISQEETGYTRKKITEMLETAYHNAVNATEQVMAARELGKLHGLYAPTKAVVKHNHDHKMRLADAQKDLSALTVAELEQQLALDGEYTEVGDTMLLEDRRG